MIGAAHPECGYFDFRFAQFSLSARLFLSVSETSFLAHYYRMLFSLPGQGHPRAVLRRCLASLLINFPNSLELIAESMLHFKEENRAEVLTYPDDLETDFYVFLSWIRSAARTRPLDVLIDFT